MTLPHPPAAQNGPPSDGGIPMAPSPDCEEVLTNFWDYLDGRCSSDVARRIGAHVDICPPCRRLGGLQAYFLESLAQIRERSSAPGRVRDRVREALEAERLDYRR